MKRSGCIGAFIVLTPTQLSEISSWRREKFHPSSNLLQRRN